MKGKGAVLLMVLCLLRAGPVAAAGEEAPAAAAGVDAVLARLERKMASVQTLSARFVQEKHLAVLEQPLVIEGEIFMQRPALFAWHVRKPLRYSMVIRGDLAQQWDEDTKRVQSVSLANNPTFKLAIRQMRGWFSGAYRSMLSEYEVSMLSEAPVSLRFVPREGSLSRAALESVTVVFQADERYIRELRIQERGGDSTLLTFRDTQLNAPIDAAAWKVEPSVR